MPEEVGQFLNFIAELEKRVVLDDLMNIRTVHLKPGTRTRSDLTLSRFFDYMRAYPRAQRYPALAAAAAAVGNHVVRGAPRSAGASAGPIPAPRCR